MRHRLEIHLRRVQKIGGRSTITTSRGTPITATYQRLSPVTSHPQTPSPKPMIPEANRIFRRIRENDLEISGLGGLIITALSNVGT